MGKEQLALCGVWSCGESWCLKPCCANNIPTILWKKDQDLLAITLLNSLRPVYSFSLLKKTTHIPSFSSSLQYLWSLFLLAQLNLMVILSFSNCSLPSALRLCTLAMCVTECCLTYWFVTSLCSNADTVLMISQLSTQCPSFYPHHRMLSKNHCSKSCWVQSNSDFTALP